LTQETISAKRFAALLEAFSNIIESMALFKEETLGEVKDEKIWLGLLHDVAKSLPREDFIELIQLSSKLAEYYSEDIWRMDPNKMREFASILKKTANILSKVEGK